MNGNVFLSLFFNCRLDRSNRVMLELAYMTGYDEYGS